MRRAQRVDRHAELLAVALQRLDLDARQLVEDLRRAHRAVGGHVVVGGGQGAVGPADLAAGDAQRLEGLRRGDLVDQVEVDVEDSVGHLVALPDLVEQGVGHRWAQLLLRPAETTASIRASSSLGFSKWWGRSASKVTASPSSQVVGDPVADQAQRAGGDHGGLAGAGLVHRRVVGPAGHGARLEPVLGELGALARERRGEHLVAVAGSARAACAALARPHHRDALPLVQPQQLGQRQLQPGGDPGGHGQRRAGLAALHLGQHRRGDAAAGGQLAQRQVHALAQGADAGADGGLGGDAGTATATGRCTLSRTFVRRVRPRRVEC